MTEKEDKYEIHEIVHVYPFQYTHSQQSKGSLTYKFDVHNYKLKIGLSKLIDPDKIISFYKPFSHCEYYCESTSKHEWSGTCRLDQNHTN